MASTAPENDVQPITVDEDESGRSKETDGSLEDGEIVDEPEISDVTVKSEAKVEPVDVPVATQVLTRSTGIEYTFGTFFNWFMPSCMDIWDASDDSSAPGPLDATQTIIAYGARSYLFLLDVHQSAVEATTKGRLTIDQSSSWSFVYHDLVNVFNHCISKKYTDVFRSTASYITTVVFEKRAPFFGKSGPTSDTQGPRVFVGNSDGAVALYNIKTRTSVLQDLPFAAFKRGCCRKVAQPKILAAAWMVTKALGSVVFYSLDTHLIRWEIDSNRVTIQHDGERDCSGAGARLLGQVAISCLASMSAEATADRREHKLAVGFNGGKIALFGFDPASGVQTSLRLLLDNAHSDDVCSLSFSGYAIGSVGSYRCGLLTSVSRDSVLKVWSLGNEAEIAEFRINTQTGGGGVGSQPRKGPQSGGPSEGQSKCNWFAASFLPRPSLPQRDPGSSGSNFGVAYEILVTAPSGELVTITLPEKEPNAKIRIAKASKFTSGSGRSGAPGPGSAVAHNSVIFSVMINAKLGIAITYSLDYKMILWDLGSRSSKAVFHHFANGALSIDSCLKDKRIAIAFGNSVYTMDFGSSIAPSSGLRTLTSGSSVTPSFAGITAYRCTTAPKAWKFYQVSWNNLSDSERLGALALGNSNGEVLVWDLNERSYTTRPAGKVGKGGDGSKIYRFVWPVKFPGALDQVRTVVLSLHASGAILVNYLPSRHYPTRPAENFMTGKFISGLPAEGLLRKHTALDEHDRGRFLVVGNDDGTVDVLKARDTSPSSDPLVLWDPTQPLYAHLYRFRAFTTPIISIEVSGNTGIGSLWVAITALHDSSCHCYRLDEEAPEVAEATPPSEEATPTTEATPTAELLVVQPRQRYKLSGHSDRVAASSWSPFSTETSGSEEGVEGQRLLVTASYDTTCIIWNVPKQTALRRFYGHRSLIYTIRWSHFREDLIFTGGEDAFHAWNWTAQPEFDPSISGSVLGKSLVTVRSLKRCFKEATNGEKTEGEVVKKKGPSSASASSGSGSAPESSASTSISPQLPTLAPVQVKALFSLSNQIENNSSKAEILEDIKWIARLREFYRSSPDSVDEIPETIIPATSLSRILLYSPALCHLKRFLAAEAENHRKRKQLEAVGVIELLVDARAAIERAIEQGQADLTLASLAVAFSRDLYKRCVESHWRSSASASGGVSTGVSSSASKSATASWSRSQRLMAAYGREMEAITRLLCLADFPGAIGGLVEAGLHREAIVLAKGGLASEEAVAGLWEAWYKVRAGGNAEGAVKCLVAAGRVKEAVELLKERRKLAAGLTTTAKGEGDEEKVGGVLQRYDEVITILEESL